MPDNRDQLVTQAVIAGISQEKGLEAYLVKEFSIDQDSFIEFIQSLADQNQGVRLAIFMDNLNVHKTKRVDYLIKRLKIYPIFSVPYSPQYNGIESYWFLLKQIYKKDLLFKSFNDQRLKISDMIHSAIQRVDDHKAKRCAQGGLRLVL